MTVHSPHPVQIKPEIKYGLGAAILLIGYTLLQFAAGFHTTNFGAGYYSSYGIFVILAYFLYLSLTEKQRDMGVLFTLRLGLRTALIQMLLCAFLASGFMLLYDYFINPLWVENMVVWKAAHTGHFNLAISANDPQASAFMLSHTETHLCLYFLEIVLGGMSIGFMITAIRLARHTHQL